MASSILRRAAVGVAAVGLAALTTVLPASAAVTNVTSVASTEGGPPATLVEYSLDASSPTRGNPCSDVARTEERITLTVSESGEYRFSDLRSRGFIPRQYQGTTPLVDVQDAEGYVFTESACTGYIDDTLSYQLVAGTEYTVSLRAFYGSLADFAYLISGPGTVTVGGTEPEGLSFEQAQAACVPGAAVPDGYTLRTGTSANETVRGTEGDDVIRGLGGNDTLLGLGGDDILCGGTGNDTLRGGDGADFLFGEAGNDSSYGEVGDDVIAGGLGNDLLDGGVGTDVGLDTQGSNTFRGIESRTVEPAPTPQPTATVNR